MKGLFRKSTGTVLGLIPLIVYFDCPPALTTCAEAVGNVVETFVMKSLAAMRGFGGFPWLAGAALLPGVEGREDAWC